MDDLNFVVANNLKRIRENRKLSLDKLSTLTGVSKSMLCQIERGESNPTITTLKKITMGLKVSFTTLLEAKVSDVNVVKFRDIEPISECSGKFRIYSVFPFEEGKGFEIYIAEFDPFCNVKASAHPEGTEEYITVFDGELKISINSDEFVVSKGDSIKFVADRLHEYTNISNSVTRVNLMLHYPF